MGLPTLSVVPTRNLAANTNVKVNLTAVLAVLADTNILALAVVEVTVVTPNGMRHFNNSNLTVI
jgi:hypothetical protein